MSYEEALAEAYASAPVDEVALHTLEIYHPTFKDDSGNPTAIRIVNGYDSYTLRLEADALLNPGEYVEWTGMAFELELSGFDEGKVPYIKVAIQNVTREITRYLETAIETLDPISITYRPYLASDPSGPQMNPPLHMTLSKVKVDVFQATGQATLEDVHNWPFPNRKYTPNDFPGLAR